MWTAKSDRQVGTAGVLLVLWSTNFAQGGRDTIQVAERISIMR